MPCHPFPTSENPIREGLHNPTIPHNHWELVGRFQEELKQVRGETCDVCDETSFHSKILHDNGQDVCSWCRKEREQHLNEIDLLVAANNMDHSHSPELSIAGELLIARAHVKINVLALQIMACLCQRHPYHKDAQIDSSRLSQLPDDGNVFEELRVVDLHSGEAQNESGSGPPSQISNQNAPTSATIIEQSVVPDLTVDVSEQQFLSEALDQQPHHSHLSMATIDTQTIFEWESLI